MKEILKHIGSYRRQINLRISAKALTNCLLVLILALHAYYLLFSRLDHNPQAVVVAGIMVRITLSLLFIYFLISAYRRFYSVYETARFLDRQVDHRDDLYQNVYQLSEAQADERIVELLAQQASRRIESERYRIPPVFQTRSLLLLMMLIIGILGIWAYDFDEFSRATNQLYSNRVKTILYKDTVEVAPGNATIGKNAALVISIVNPDRRLNHRLFFRYDKDWRELSMTGQRYVFDAVDNSFEYYVKNEVAVSPTYRIDVLDEPMVRRWRNEYNYPAYTGLRTEIDTLSYGNIEAYRYTQTKVMIEANIPVQSARMIRSDGSEIQMSSIDERRFIAQLQVMKADTWYLEMTDELGRRSRPEEKRITIIPDMPPQIRILMPGEDVILNQNMLLPLYFYADDDFGLKDCQLVFRVNDAPEQIIPIQNIISGKIHEKDYLWNLRDLQLLPGHVVTYYAVIYDNYPESQKGVSQSYRARFPSIEEIFRELERQDARKKDELQSMLDRSRELQQEFEQRRREWLRDEKLNWQEQRQLENILQNQEKLSEQVEKIAENYQDLIDKMQANQALPPETLDKMMKIQELMQEISNDDLMAAMQKFQNALQNLDPEFLKKAMENFRFSIEDFNQRIDQTLKLLESIKKEQAVQKALQISEEMEKMQAALQQKTTDHSQDSQRLAQEQQNIAGKYDNLKQELDKISKMLDPQQDRQAMQQLQELMREMQRSQMEQNLSKSASSLSQNQRSQSMSEQEEARAKMRTFTQMLAAMKESMGGSSQQMVAQAMQNAIREILIFSKKHEETAARFGNDPYQIISDLIAQYEGLQISMNRLFANPQVTLFLPPKFYMDLSYTNQNYREIFTNIGDPMFRATGDILTNIQRGLNLMAYDLMQALNNPSAGSGGGSGMQSLMQMLEQMGQEQMAMNMLTEQLMMQLMQQGGRQDAAMQQQIQRLAQEQQRLADNLRRALQNNPEAQKQGNAIQQIIDDADTVARQLRNNQINRDLLQRQERILSRMLDATRSINKREFTEKRRGETAETVPFSRSDGDFDYNQMRRNAMLDEQYRTYPREYQQVIQRYLKILNEKANQ